MAKVKVSRDGTGRELDARELTQVEQLTQDYQQTFNSDSGARVLLDLRQRFGRRRSFASEPHQTSFNEGQRDVYLMVMAFLDKDLTDPEEVPRG